MGPFIALAVATAAFVKGALLGAVVGGAAVACACRRPRSGDAVEHPETPEPRES